MNTNIINAANNVINEVSNVIINNNQYTLSDCINNNDYLVDTIIIFVTILFACYIAYIITNIKK
ncbi:MAG: hypothetical protein MSA15_07950 [Clostridium sp.]|nr:hypothetical protein [Clostridium sp.]